MMYIKFLNEDCVHEAKATASGAIVTLTFNEASNPNLNGFDCFLDENQHAKIGGDKYHNATTLYKIIDDFTYQLSLDGSVYVEPPITVSFVAGNGGNLTGNTSQIVENYSELIIPTPVANENYEFVEWTPAIPTEGKIGESQTFTAVFVYNEPLSSVIERKVAEMNDAQQAIIANGVDVTLTDGTTHRFSLTTNDQLSVMGSVSVQGMFEKGTPWHIADESVHCQYFSDEDMALISTAAYTWVLYHVTYFRDLRIYIRSLGSKEEVEAISYGVLIPEEYQSEVLADYYASVQ